MTAALWVEAVKAMRGNATWVITAAVAIGPASISVALLLAARNDNAVAAAQLEPFTRGDPWADLATLMGVIGAAGGLLAFGTYLGWSFGREFTDRTIGSMFAIPTSLRQIATAKLAVYAAVVSVTTAICVAAYLVAGLAMHYPSADTPWAAAFQLAAVLALTGLLATPCAWAATASKGVLGAVGLAVALLALSQIAIFTVGAWFPFAVAGAWAGLAGTGPLTPNAAQMLLAVVTGAGFAVLTVHRWGQLRLR